MIPKNGNWFSGKTMPKEKYTMSRTLLSWIRL